LNKFIGYEAAAKIAKHSVAKGLTVREATIELGYVDGEKLTMEQLDKALDVMPMTRPPQ
jgi:fumarate hydratase class II